MSDERVQDPIGDPAALGHELVRELLDVTLEEFRLTESRFESDCRLGRELLYLLSNTEWARRTTEILDISRVSAVETSVVVDVDMSYIAHEALRTVEGPIWLPLMALPRQIGQAAGFASAGDAVDAPVSVDVTDGGGTRVAEVPQAEVRRQLAAALAETLVTRLNRRTGVRWAAESDPRPTTRDHQVLLAAVLARLLTQPPAPAPASTPDRLVYVTAATSRGNRLKRAQGQLWERIVAEMEAASLEAAPRQPVDGDADRAFDTRSTLTSREAEIVQAVRGSTLVVVPVDPSGPPTSFTVRMPARRLLREPADRYASRARIRVALLVPTTHADRVVQVDIPDGVRLLGGDGPDSVAEAHIEVVAPQQFEQLRLLVERILGHDPDGDAASAPGQASRPPAWVRKQLAELAVVKLHAAIQCLRHYYVTVDRTEQTELMRALRELREPLDAEAHGRTADLAGPWERARELLPERLRRRLERSTTSPGSVRFRASAIEEFTLRSEPTEAYVELTVVAGDSPVLGTARAVNGINIGVLAGIAALLWLVPATQANGSRSDVLATLLTLFPTIQASRLRQPDSTRLVGLLTMRHFTVGLLTAVPGLMLAGVLAFAPTGRLLIAAALVAVVLQVGCHLLIRAQGDPTGRRPWVLRRLDRLPGRRRGIRLRTVQAADHRGFNVLRAAWCRSLTGDVLLLGRTAHPYIVLDRDEPGSLTDLLARAQGEVTARAPGPGVGTHPLQSHDPSEPVPEPVNVLGILRGTAIGRSVTFLLFRDPPRAEWLETVTRDPAGHAMRETRAVSLDHGRLAPTEPPDWVLDVMIGIPDEAGGLPVDAHPLAQVAFAAKAGNFTLLNVQLPAPPPLQDAQERQWVRLRVGVPYRRGDSLRKLVRFLARLDEMSSGGNLVHLREVPQMQTLDATQTAPEDSFDELPGARVATVGKTRTGRLVTDADLRVRSDPGDTWRLVAICAQPRAGLLADVLGALRHHAGVRSVAGAISGIFNGTGVIFLLCRLDPAEPVDPPALTRRIQRALRPHRTVVHVLEEVRAAATSIGTRPRALLRVQIRTPDRPGVIQDLLRELARQVHREAYAGADGAWRPAALPGGSVDGERPGPRPRPRWELPLVANGSEPKVDVLYALTPVVDGQALSGRLLMRLPYHHHGNDRWIDADWQDIGRVVAQAMSRDGARTLAAAERTSRLSDDTVVTLDLVRRPSASDRTTAPTPVPDDRGLAMTDG